MRYFVRLILIPLVTAFIANRFLVSQIEYAGYWRYKPIQPETILLSFIVGYVFFSQLNWVFTLHRLDELESRLNK